MVVAVVAVVAVGLGGVVALVEAYGFRFLTVFGCAVSCLMSGESHVARR